MRVCHACVLVLLLLAQDGDALLLGGVPCVTLAVEGEKEVDGRAMVGVHTCCDVGSVSASAHRHDTTLCRFNHVEWFAILHSCWRAMRCDDTRAKTT